MTEKSPVPISAREFNRFLFQMLCKRKRRRHLMLQWNTQMPFKASTLDAVFKQFFECILSAPVRFVVEDTYVSFFGENLRIPYAWLLPEEQAVVTRIIDQRSALFSREMKLESDRLSLRGFKWDRAAELPIEQRREIVRDMVHYLCLVDKDEKQRQLCRYYLLRVCQRMIVEKRSNTDRFILELHHSLQCSATKLENILTY